MKPATIRMLAVLMTSAALTACGTTGGPRGEGAAVEEAGAGAGAGTAGYQDGDAYGEGAATTGAAGREAFTGHPLEDPSSPLSQRVVYFEFDSSQITQDARQLLEAHSAYLADHPETSIRLEGHTDERGSREYNLGLGERRVESVRQVMELLGVNGDQLNSVSYGEEKPACMENYEACWSKNRRVELVYPEY